MLFFFKPAVLMLVLPLLLLLLAPLTVSLPAVPFLSSAGKLLVVSVAAAPIAFFLLFRSPGSVGPSTIFANSSKVKVIRALLRMSTYLRREILALR